MSGESNISELLTLFQQHKKLRVRKQFFRVTVLLINPTRRLFTVTVHMTSQFLEQTIHLFRVTSKKGS